MPLVDELIGTLENMIEDLSDILKAFSYDGGLLETMKNYELKKNIAKTAGTAIGTVGLILTPFTFGLSLTVTAVGAGVNLITDLVDSDECRTFQKEVERLLNSIGPNCKKYEELLERLNSASQQLMKDYDMDPEAALYYALSTSSGSLDKQNLAKLAIPVLAKGTRVALKLTPVQLKLMNQMLELTGLSFLKMGGKTGAKAGVGFIKGIGKATIVLGGIVAVIETVSVFKDWTNKHPTIKAAEKVVADVEQMRSSLRDNLEVLRKMKIMEATIEQSATKSNQSRQPTKQGTSKGAAGTGSKSGGQGTRKNAAGTGSGSGGDPPYQQNDQSKNTCGSSGNETEINVEEDRTLPNGERLRIISAIVRPRNLGGGSTTNNSTARNWIRSLGLGEGYDAGHIIANILGGSGSNLNNLVPMPRSFNRGGYKSFENEIFNLIKEYLKLYPMSNIEARVIVKLHYRQGSQVPYKIIYEVTFYVDDTESQTRRVKFKVISDSS